MATYRLKIELKTLMFNLINSQYPDSILRQVMSQLRKSQMVSKKKQNTKKYLKDEVPITTIPFHLSVSFMHKFINKYQNDLFRNIDKFMAKLIEEKTLDFLHGPGGSASVVTLTAMNAIKYKIQVPEQVIVLDPNLSESNKAYKVYLEKYKNLVNEEKTPKSVTEVLQKDLPGEIY